MYEDRYKDDLYYQYRYIDEYRGRTITKEDVLHNERLLSDIRTQVQHERMRSKGFVGEKRALFQSWDKLIRTPDASERATVKVRMAQQHLKTFISTFYHSDLTTSFTGREFMDDDYAYALEKLCAYDFEAMNFDRKKFAFLNHIGRYGSGIRIETGWNKTKQCIDFMHVSPKYRYPDPQGNVFDGFRYHGFDASISKNEMQAINKQFGDEVYFNLDKIDASINVDYEANRRVEDAANLLDSNMERWGRLSIHHWYTEICGRKYLTSRSALFNTLIRFEPIEAVDKFERDNPELIPYPINIGQVFPLDGDPFGMGIVELILDFQNAKNRLLNLALIKEERNAGFRQYLVDISKVNNLNVFERRNQSGPTFIPVRGGNTGIGNSVVPVGDDPNDGQTLNLSNQLDMEAQMQDGFTNQSRGVPTTKQQTLGQTQMQEQNANVLFELDAQVLSRSETDFVKNFRYRGLKKYMTNYEEKSARVLNGMASVTYSIKRNELVSMLDPDIKVESKSIAISRNKEKRDYMLAREQAMMMNPWVPEISKIMYMRELDKLAGLPREEIYRNNPITPDERRAIIYYKLINLGETPKNLFEPGMDYFTYYVYISNCKENQAKKDVLRQLEQKIIEEKKQKDMQAAQQGAPGNPAGGMQGVANSMTSQMTSNMLKNGQQPQGRMTEQG